MTEDGRRQPYHGGNINPTLIVSLETVCSTARPAGDKEHIRKTSLAVAARSTGDNLKVRGWGYGGRDTSDSSTRVRVLTLHKAVPAEVDRGVMEDMQVSRSGQHRVAS